MDRDWNNLCRCRRGFTLLELALVMVLAAALVAIAVPRYAGAAGNYRVQMAARKVAADLSRARSEAWNTSTRHTVTFDAGNRQYTLTAIKDSNNGVNANTVVKLTADPYQVTAISTSFGNTISFDGYGIPSAGGTITLTTGSLQQTVTINATTGNITIP